jgi:flagellar motor switch protein FliG
MRVIDEHIWPAYTVSLGGFMGNRRAIVVTAYGHDRIIDNIAVSSFELSGNSDYDDQSSDAKTYCDTINSLKLKDNSWVFAKIISENTPYALDGFRPLNFLDVIMELDDRAVQRILREMDSRDIARALKDQDATATALEKIFSNMSKRASQMLKEDMEFMGPLETRIVKDSQEKFLNVIRHLEQTGEIILPDHIGGAAE